LRMRPPRPTILSPMLARSRSCMPKEASSEYHDERDRCD
jgi:hypothetical protein